MIPPSPLTSRGAAGFAPALIPTRSVDTSTNNVSVSTARSFVIETVLRNVPVPCTWKLDAAPVRVSEPVMVSPALRTFSEAEPLMVAVIVPAEKLPDASRLTAVFPIFAVWNSMLPSFQILLPLTEKPSALTTCTLRVPDPSDALPPEAIIAEL